MRKTGVLLAVLLAVVACEEPIYTPRPRAFPKVVFPAHTYQLFEGDFCPFGFSFPKYAEVLQDKEANKAAPPNACWFDLALKPFDGRVHFTYYPMETEADFEQLMTDAFELANKHNVRADFIEESAIERPEEDVYGFFFKIEGAAASPYQFFLTDRSAHFVRASLYFNTQARPDSLAPIHAFVQQDLEHLIETFEWAN